MRLSNYPSNVTTSDLPGWQQSSLEESYECIECMEECDPFEEPFVNLDGNPVCPGCRVMCSAYCGEWLEDESIATHGKIIRFRDPTANGKLVMAHAECAAEYLLMMLGVPDRDASREEIALAVYLSQPARRKEPDALSSCSCRP